MSRNYWENIYQKKNISDDESWLKQFEKLVPKKSCCLDLGCGLGTDSEYLSDLGNKIVSADFSKNVLDKLPCNFNKVLLDVSQSMPFSSNSIDIFNASLSLHYFNLKTIQNIITEIEKITKPGGLFFCRVNSKKTQKIEYPKAVKIENNFYKVGDVTRYFFDEADIISLLKKYSIVHLEEKEILYFGKKKFLWDIIVKF